MQGTVRTDKILGAFADLVIFIGMGKMGSDINLNCDTFSVVKTINVRIAHGCRMAGEHKKRKEKKKELHDSRGLTNEIEHCE
mmetsp:Transcript_20950/g.25244  ORF Transcript_20950/g.25244 Transcript_20950/m.25244 type:complete len:82 (-) Transcript_20950:100-345(-)